MSEYPKFEDLQGKTLVKAERVGDDVMRFVTSDGDVFELYHEQSCCESVVIDEVAGDLSDLVGSPILLAEEATSNDDPQDVADRKAAEKAKNPDYYDWTDSQTWTFYKLRTLHGSVDIRWHGSSNGYYSESVDFRKVS